MRFHGERKLIFAVRFHFLSTRHLNWSALISQEFLCDGEVENYSHEVAEHAGDEISYSGCKEGFRKKLKVCRWCDTLPLSSFASGEQDKDYKDKRKKTVNTRQ